METNMTNLSTKELKYSIFRILEHLNDGTERRLLIIDEKDINSDISKKLRGKSYNSTTFSFNNDEKKFGVQKYYLIENTKEQKSEVQKYYNNYLNFDDWIRDYGENDISNSINPDKCDLYVFIEK